MGEFTKSINLPACSFRIIAAQQKTNNKQKMALHLREDEARRLTAAKTKGTKEEEIDKMDKIPKIKKLLKDRGSELEKVIEGAKGVCMIEVGLELEMDQRDMDEALEIDDPEQLVEVFPALTKANAQRLLDILKAKKAKRGRNPSSNPRRGSPSTSPSNPP